MNVNEYILLTMFHFFYFCYSLAMSGWMFSHSYGQFYLEYDIESRINEEVKKFSPNINNTNNGNWRKEKEEENNMSSTNVNVIAKVIRHWLKPVKGERMCSKFVSIYDILEKEKMLTAKMSADVRSSYTHTCIAYNRLTSVLTDNISSWFSCWVELFFCQIVNMDVEACVCGNIYTLTKCTYTLYLFTERVPNGERMWREDEYCLSTNARTKNARIYIFTMKNCLRKSIDQNGFELLSRLVFAQNEN